VSDMSLTANLASAFSKASWELKAMI